MREMSTNRYQCPVPEQNADVLASPNAPSGRFTKGLLAAVCLFCALCLGACTSFTVTSSQDGVMYGSPVETLTKLGEGDYLWVERRISVRSHYEGGSVRDVEKREFLACSAKDDGFARCFSLDIMCGDESEVCAQTFRPR